MTATPTSFREAFNAFASSETFSPSTIQYWLTLAYKLHNADRYGDLLDDAVMLYAAHNLTLEAQSAASVAAGQSPGQVLGAIASASVDKVSYSRDTSSGMDPSSGHWNLTSYGVRWKQLANLMGAGPLHIGGGDQDVSGGYLGPSYIPAVWP